jgi:hypothetical protein
MYFKEKADAREASFYQENMEQILRTIVNLH